MGGPAALRQDATPADTVEKLREQSGTRPGDTGAVAGHA